jgi:hypothetical protein
MSTPHFAFVCPDCEESFEQGTQAHQHENGEWIYTEDLRRWHQFYRWQHRLDNACVLVSRWEPFNPEEIDVVRDTLREFVRTARESRRLKCAEALIKELEMFA